MAELQDALAKQQATEQAQQKLLAQEEQQMADAIALSIVFPEGDPGVAEELRRLRDAVGPDLPILVGGRASPSYEKALNAIGATVIADLAGLRASLNDVAAAA